MNVRRTFARLAIAVGFLSVALAVLAVAALVFRLVSSRPPFLILLTPGDDGTEIQFLQPLDSDDRLAVSPKFIVRAQIDEPFQAALTSGKIQIPGAIIEFLDTTILPGRFRLRIGDSKFDIMSHRIVANGRDYDWHRKPVLEKTTLQTPPD